MCSRRALPYPEPTNDREVWRTWYKRARWERLRLAQLHAYPLCSMCEAEGKVELATVVHHIKAHKGNPALFFDPSNLASVCKPHHDRDLHSQEMGGAPWVPTPEVDGWPGYRAPRGVADRLKR
jgi:5-methylcytosine-specific restriction endonuclease McrA